MKSLSNKRSGGSTFGFGLSGWRKFVCEKAILFINSIRSVMVKSTLVVDHLHSRIHYIILYESHRMRGWDCALNALIVKYIP